MVAQHHYREAVREYVEEAGHRLYEEGIARSSNFAQQAQEKASKFPLGAAKNASKHVGENIANTTFEYASKKSLQEAFNAVTAAAGTLAAIPKLAHFWPGIPNLVVNYGLTAGTGALLYSLYKGKQRSQQKLELAFKHVVFSLEKSDNYDKLLKDSPGFTREVQGAVRKLVAANILTRAEAHVVEKRVRRWRWRLYVQQIDGNDYQRRLRDGRGAGLGGDSGSPPPPPEDRPAPQPAPQPQPGSSGTGQAETPGRPPPNPWTVRGPGNPYTSATLDDDDDDGDDDEPVRGPPPGSQLGLRGPYTHGIRDDDDDDDEEDEDDNAPPPAIVQAIKTPPRQHSSPRAPGAGPVPRRESFGGPSPTRAAGTIPPRRAPTPRTPPKRAPTPTISPRKRPSPRDGPNTEAPSSLKRKKSPKRGPLAPAERPQTPLPQPDFEPDYEKIRLVTEKARNDIAAGKDAVKSSAEKANRRQQDYDAIQEALNRSGFVGEFQKLVDDPPSATQRKMTDQEIREAIVMRQIRETMSAVARPRIPVPDVEEEEEEEDSEDSEEDEDEAYGKGLKQAIAGMSSQSTQPKRPSHDKSPSPGKRQSPGRRPNTRAHPGNNEDKQYVSTGPTRDPPYPLASPSDPSLIFRDPDTPSEESESDSDDEPTPPNAATTQKKRSPTVHVEGEYDMLKAYNELYARLGAVSTDEVLAEFEQNQKIIEKAEKEMDEKYARIRGLR